MSVYTKLIWPVADPAAVCALQNPAPGNLLLNGTLANITSLPDQISFREQNYIRSVSITSANTTISSAIFVVTGFQNGAIVTEQITGVNNNTVYGAKSYDQIVSVSVNQAVIGAGVSVGSGNKGFFPLIVINSTANSINYSAQISLPAPGINYSMLQTLEQVNTNYISLETQLDKFFPCLGLTNETTSQLVNSQEILNYVLLKVNSSATPLTDTFNFTFLQT